MPKVHKNVPSSFGKEKEKKGNECTANIFIMCLDFCAR
jgi:hypothetical protein